MKIVLIIPRFEDWSTRLWVPLGLAYIGAVLEKAGHLVEIIDSNIVNSNELRNRLEKDIDIVGITGTITEYQNVLELLKIARETQPSMPIILGGPLATSLPKELLMQTPLDFAVMGEGENTVVDLINTIENGGEISEVGGIAYIENGEVLFTKPAIPIENLDTIPFPALHLLDMKKYTENHFEIFGVDIKGHGKIKSTHMITSRGCPYQCIFCFKGIWGNKWRGRSPENIVAEIELLKKKYDISAIWFSDDTFVLDRKRVTKFCNLIRERDLDIIWGCHGRIDLMRKELLKEMSLSGCIKIAYGFESGDQRILDLMKKGFTLDQARKVVKWTKEAGIHVGGYFMIGMLDETKETINNTINFAKGLDLDTCGFSITTPFPGTKLFEKATERGLVVPTNTVGEWRHNINTNLTRDCTNDDLLRFKNKIFIEFELKRKFGKFYMLNPMFIWKITKKFSSFRNFEETSNFIKNVQGVVKSYLK